MHTAAHSFPAVPPHAVANKVQLVMVATTDISASSWRMLLQLLRTRVHEVGDVILVPCHGRALQLMGMAQRLASHCQQDAALPNVSFTVREPAGSHTEAKRTLLAERPELEPHDVYVTFLN